MEPRTERHLSEVRHFQEFRTKRDLPEVTEGNRRNKKHKVKDVMKGIVEHQFGRKGRSVSHHGFRGGLLSTKETFMTDQRFYSKIIKYFIF